MAQVKVGAPFQRFSSSAAIPTRACRSASAGAAVSAGWTTTTKATVIDGRSLPYFASSGTSSDGLATYRARAAYPACNGCHRVGQAPVCAAERSGLRRLGSAKCARQAHARSRLFAPNVACPIDGSTGGNTAAGDGAATAGTARAAKAILLVVDKRRSVQSATLITAVRGMLIDHTAVPT
jgi:hypothetical protein